MLRGQAHAIIPQWTLAILMADYPHKPLDPLDIDLGRMRPQK